ncbi:MAG TPA: peptidoglycan DD-metalloendopeptidase family protein, partial [Pseudoxanthomonas sp.]
IEEQRKADLAAAEKRRAEQLEREKERERQAQARAEAAKANAAIVAKGGKPKPLPPVDKPVVAANEPGPQAPVPKFDIADGAFAAQRGKMKPPVRGALLAKFGAKRGDGPSWKGWFIKADAGTEVRAVADGRIGFAEWMRGYGNLIIVNHGNNYLSVYGNNQALLKRQNDVVKAGDVIATTGNTGGNEESGLYFELRFQGLQIDPAAWIKF